MAVAVRWSVSQTLVVTCILSLCSLKTSVKQTEATTVRVTVNGGIHSVGQLMFPVSSQVLLEEAQEEELITVDAVGCFEEEGEEEEEGAVVEEEVDVADEEEDAATKEEVKSGRPVASSEITIQE